MDIEKKLEDAKADYQNSIVIPSHIDSYIQTGIKKKRKSNTRKSILKVAACFILMFLVSIRISPAFAEAVSEIPFLDRIVELINYDKSLQYAVENEYVQSVGKYDEHEGIRFMVNHIIADESSIFIFYDVENNSKHKKIEFILDELLDENGENLKAGFSWSGLVDEERLGMINITFSDEADLPGKIIVKAKFEALEDNELDVKEMHVEDVYESVREKNQMLESTWSIEIQIDKERIKSMKEIHEINKTVSVQNQIISINSVTIFPTRTLVDVSFDPNNSMFISELKGLRLVDDRGEVYASINNGVTAMGDGDQRVYYLDSSYFKKPKKLYLEFDGLRGIDKRYQWVEVDLFNEKVLSDLGEYVTCEGINTSAKSNQYFLKFDVKQYDEEDSIAQIFSSVFEDLEGNQYHSHTQSCWTNDDDLIYSMRFMIEKAEFKDDFDGKIRLKRTGVTDFVEGKISFSINK